ncbi:hypothetical protein J1C67_09710 [Clostridium gasigenes]|uniref:hypothetical protein n=1 Tax=Clostridium gasigenes TaxID=94869 RepID=UPI0014382D2B|nr:hypothetical protein [Clostridium gasigenes]NKF07419.1 hypothetical protein [Clostridium gasigenes]QSW17861.1 hypothetical protein J1C67_09710 [Clostridium gasigenes]
MDKDRKIGLDIVRVIVIIFVLSVQFFAHTKYYTTSLSGKSMCIQTFIRTL